MDIKTAIQELKKDCSYKGSVIIGFLKGETYPDGLEVAQVAEWNEKGTVIESEEGERQHVPPRPFIEKTRFTHSGKWNEIITRGVASGNDIEEILTEIGIEAVKDMKQTIIDFTNPANAPSTIRKKGKDDPLRDTDTMLETVSYEVNLK